MKELTKTSQNWEQVLNELNDAFSNLMLETEKNKNLKKFNTLQVSVKSKYFVVISNIEDLRKVVNFGKENKLKILVLGEGSNILLTKNFNGLVIKNEIGGKKVKEYKNKVIVSIGSGTNWHKLVRWAVNKGYGGIENLAFIPGTVGAAPVQNIAAYGQNFSDVFEKLKALEIKSGKIKTFSKKECEFSYRNSIFKGRLKDKYIITECSIKLNKNPSIEASYYQIGISYDSIKNELEVYAKKPYNIKDVFNAVIRIRKRKLPDWKKVPTVGSFFINPIVSKNELIKLQKQIDELQYYPLENLQYKDMKERRMKKSKYVKVPAGRLLDYLGWRGKCIGNCCMYKKHALVLIHNGKASGKEIYNFSKVVQNDCLKKLGIKLDTEVELI